MRFLARHPLFLVPLVAACVSKADELSSLDRDGDGSYHEAASALGEVGPFDCNDDDPNVYPGADELCNDVDDNCDAAIDEDAAIDATNWYSDGDRDGWGLASESRRACEAPDPALFTDRSGDCDDGDDGVHPEQEDVCNAVDDDCNGTSTTTSPPGTAMSTRTGSAIPEQPS